MANLNINASIESIMFMNLSSSSSNLVCLWLYYSGLCSSHVKFWNLDYFFDLWFFRYVYLGFLWSFSIEYLYIFMMIFRCFMLGVPHLFVVILGIMHFRCLIHYYSISNCFTGRALYFGGLYIVDCDILIFVILIVLHFKVD